MEPVASRVRRSRGTPPSRATSPWTRRGAATSSPASPPPTAYGAASRLALAAFKLNGQPDTSFSGDGKLIADTLTGGAGKDQLRGEGGSDTLYANGDNAADFLDGGPGIDKARKDGIDFAQYVEQLLA
jgi:Ca2+-binding RTX toxin-like protein